jgi:hypothetical protein
MHRELVLIAALFIGGRLPSQSQPPATYDVKVEFDHVSTGTATFAVDKTGKVSGSLHIDTPTELNAELAGTVKDGTWTFEFSFSMPTENCSGTASGTAKVTTDLNTVSGTVKASGECTPDPVSGPFTFTKRLKKAPAPSTVVLHERRAHAGARHRAASVTRRA